ncbi:MAG: YhcH/YjgK/YiaL family protein [Hymenobacteraceae bacterium]|nr:YhcH/YjgK/YiaL family protein [Hymenobacteraceae bacterium]MDX5395834.1 YhcH/YjgK/YiaL family protein [Hymenobacteraceae bacterium]MDX5443348.1 YhcH/YjgK/YiaL family protein [Hymenobacteraceae bacterium]MDX5511889.1 YhcH/YjgK/YiaL family protein [Hymenobacteraceae bacterium]
MILDSIKNASHYITMHYGFETAFHFLKHTNLEELEPGKYEIEDDKIFAIVSEGSGVDKAQAKLEAHRKYIDIQYIISGYDHMGWRAIQDCSEIEKKYDEEKDFMFFSDKAETWFDVPPGHFTIFFPHDAHAPMSTTHQVRKVVVKIALIS